MSFFFLLLPPSHLAMVLTEAFPCMILHRRNLSCIGCGCPRSAGNDGSAPHYRSNNSPTRIASSPRFYTSQNQATSFSPAPPHSSPSYPCASSQPQPSFTPSPISHPVLSASKPPPPAHPLLTPSGRAFASGGKVQNVSSDPLSPCIMYWPDNEPFPEQGQIRPSGLMGVPVRLIAHCIYLRC